MQFTLNCATQEEADALIRAAAALGVTVEPPPGTSERRTVIERGRFEIERDVEDPDEEDAPRIVSEGISGPPSPSISSQLVPEEAWPLRRSEYGLPGRWEIIVRFTPE